MKNILFLVTLQLLHSLALVRSEDKNERSPEEELVELNRKKMVVLIPFQLLKLKKMVKNGITKETLKALQNLIENDILGSIKANFQVGNITRDDADQLIEMTNLLYQHICDHYEELRGAGEMKPLLDGAMELPLDKYRIQIDQLEAEKVNEQKPVIM